MKEIVCPFCDGDGFHIVDGGALEPWGVPIDTSKPCEVCDGTGRIALTAEAEVDALELRLLRVAWNKLTTIAISTRPALGEWIGPRAGLEGYDLSRMCEIVNRTSNAIVGLR